MLVFLHVDSCIKINFSDLILSRPPWQRCLSLVPQSHQLGRHPAYHVKPTVPEPSLLLVQQETARQQPSISERSCLPADALATLSTDGAWRSPMPPLDARSSQAMARTGAAFPRPSHPTSDAGRFSWDLFFSGAGEDVLGQAGYTKAAGGAPVSYGTGDGNGGGGKDSYGIGDGSDGGGADGGWKGSRRMGVGGCRAWTGTGGCVP